MTSFAFGCLLIAFLRLEDGSRGRSLLRENGDHYEMVAEKLGPGDGYLLIAARNASFFSCKKSLLLYLRMRRRAWSRS